jgi:predicted transcriptional regulator of viral defense system
LDLVEIKTDIIEKLQKLRTKSVVLLDTELPKSGKIQTKWSIQQNIEKETISKAIYT